MTTTITLPQSIIQRLEKLNRKQSTSAFVKQAVLERLSYEEWALKQIDAGLAEIKAGKTIPHDEFLRQIGLTKHAKKAA